MAAEGVCEKKIQFYLKDMGLPPSTVPPIHPMPLSYEPSRSLSYELSHPSTSFYPSTHPPFLSNTTVEGCGDACVST